MARRQKITYNTRTESSAASDHRKIRALFPDCSIALPFRSDIEDRGGGVDVSHRAITSSVALYSQRRGLVIWACTAILKWYYKDLTSRAGRMAKEVREADERERIRRL